MEEWADDFRQLARVLVVGRVRSRSFRDIHAQAPGKPAGDIGEDGKAVLAYEQAHRRAMAANVSSSGMYSS